MSRFREGTAEYWIESGRGPQYGNLDVVEGLRYFDLQRHEVIVGWRNGVIREGVFSDFRPEDWALRHFLDIWECECVPSLRPEWRRRMAPGDHYSNLRMYHPDRKPFERSTDGNVDWRLIDLKWGKPGYNVDTNVGPYIQGADYHRPIVGRIQCTAMHTQMTGLIRHAWPGTDTVSDFLHVDPAPLCIWPEVERLDNRQVSWKFHAAIFCYRILNFEGPANWDSGTLTEASRRLTEIQREWTALGRYFEGRSLTLNRLLAAMGEEENDRMRPFWKDTARGNVRVSLDSDIPL